MAENPFDESWLDSVMDGFGETEGTNSVDEDLDNISPENSQKMWVASHYLAAYYPPVDPGLLERTEDAAFKMMRTLAHFLENAWLDVEGEKIRVGDTFPTVGVSHINLIARYNLRDVKNELRSSVEGTTAHAMRIGRQSYFSAIAKISEKAMEFEEKRRKREEGLQ